ncbi:MAG TPA: excalibur calcium-binding domain-containing protein [Rhodanobacter sp.]|nr:excalibur calcium-binding domain-containing protein [Rhodanobacter sp.]
MTSCAEATCFLKQCPGTQRDGDGDGEPCESQWCGASRSD